MTQDCNDSADAKRTPEEQAILDALERDRGAPLSAAEAQFALLQARAIGEL